MNTETQAKPDDFSKVLQLLEEYTTKLSHICDQKLQADYRTLLIHGILGALCVFFITIVGFMAFGDSKGFSGTAIMGAFLAFGVILTLLIYMVGFHFLLGRPYRFKFAFDADQIAATIERLIKLCSQYGEHSLKHISDRFEYELRLAEAEATLKLYYTVFRKNAKKPVA